jgi:sulfur carrier protein ThiS
MTIIINNKQQETQASTVSELATLLQLPPKGVAIAIDNQLNHAVPGTTHRSMKAPVSLLSKQHVGGEADGTVYFPLFRAI